MAGGFMGQILNVDLSRGAIQEEVLGEQLCRDFVGGYGIGARLILDRQKGGVDPLGPENILAFMTGPLTGTPAYISSRFTVMGKSPLTGGWGDANCGGNWGPHLKFAGFDGVFVSGSSAKPVYLYINEGKAELRDATALWGKDTHETEAALKAELGSKAEIVSIGPSGERLSLISCIINDRGRAAGRSGVGAIMGAKKLKAIVVDGNRPVPLADPAKCRELSRQFLEELKGPIVDFFRNLGTAGITVGSAKSGDSPVKNWGGVGVVDFPDADPIGGPAVLARRERPYGCWHCPVACGGIMKGPDGPYAYEPGSHKPEYETLCSFGTLCLNNNLESIIKANDICNRYGLDTISAGATIAFAIECYENGLITKADTDGIELTWGNHQAIVAMTEKLARREGFGDVLADGVKVAAEKIGKGADQYAMHIGGQELPMHDPKFRLGYAISYVLDATPARHTQGAEGVRPRGLTLPPTPRDRNVFTGRGEAHRILMNVMHVVNTAGLCMFGMDTAGFPWIPAFVNAVTGWEWDEAQLLKTGERIAALRSAFNAREGIKMTALKVPGRVFGKPAQKEGPLAGVEIDEKTLHREYLEAAGWDVNTGWPTESAVEALGLADVARMIYRS